MPTYSRAWKEAEDIAKEQLKKWETHKPLVECEATIDFMFAFGDVDEQGEQQGDAISDGGYRALAKTRKIPLKDRAAGRADAEILIDGDWWKDASDGERAALIDHELHHLGPKIDKRGLKRDDLGRPVLELRKHDYHFGTFNVIAARHGEASQERQQMHAMFQDHGQYYWPDIAGKVDEENTLTIKTDKQSVTVPMRRFSNIAKQIQKDAKGVA